MRGIAGLLAVGALAALANLVGGLLVISSGAHRREAKLLKYLIALGAGFMLAAIFIEILPETISLWNLKLIDAPSVEFVVIPMRDDAMSALSNLGYQKAAAEKAVKNAIDEGGDLSVEVILRRSLRSLAKV